MPSHTTIPELRLQNIAKYLTVTAKTMEILARGTKTPFLEAISSTTQSLLKNIESVKQNKDECASLVERSHQLLKAIILVHINSDTGGELPPSILNPIGKFTQTLHKIHTFVEAQQSGNKVTRFFRQSEMSSLLKDCKTGLQQGFDSFQLSQRCKRMATRDNNRSST
ncbi:hypothetical protein B0H19DRAFT_1079235 [Mycena capillaripes]|nr:hypothetical protein B0H19DRAFT_1079235 [Mycena capillaripes]